MVTWTFLTNHARVLLVIGGNPNVRLRDIADAVGISERRTHDIVTDLAESGYLAKQRTGRRNTYEVLADRPLGDDLAEERTVGDLLTILSPDRPPRQGDADDRSSSG